jgi:hypothetical protein
MPAVPACLCAGRWGGAITAALFLQESVLPRTAWAHLDVAGPAWDDDAGVHRPAHRLWSSNADRVGAGTGTPAAANLRQRRLQPAEQQQPETLGACRTSDSVSRSMLKQQRGVTQLLSVLLGACHTVVAHVRVRQ